MKRERHEQVDKEEHKFMEKAKEIIPCFSLP
jgi:hypothetical protein